MKRAHALFFLLTLLLLTAPPAARAQESFARLEIEPSPVYAGQPFTLRLSIGIAGRELRDLQLGGLPVESLQLQPFQEMPPVSETLNGIPYSVFRTRIDALCPTPGTLRFAPVVQGTAVRTVQAFVFTQRIESPVTIHAPPVELVVKPLPLADAPAGYAGLIGAFTLEAHASTNRVLPGDLVTLSFTVSGRGRFDLLPRLGHAAIPGFKVYPAREDKSRSGVRRATQVVIPQEAGSLSIPSFSFTAFNPEKETFETLAAGPFAFEPDANRPANTPPPVLILNDDGGAAGEPAAAYPLHPALRRPPGDPALRAQAEALFKAGADAYAAGRPDEAIDAYSKLLALGVRSPEAHMNLGAAFARSGRRGKAVLFLLRAVRAAPRDALARLHLAAAAVPAHPPALPFWSRLSRAEWKAATAATGAAAFVLLLLLPRRRWSWWLFPPALAVALLSGGGLLWWDHGPPVRERVALAPGQGRLAPRETAAATLKLDEGAVVSLLETAEDWYRVDGENGTAWAPAAALEKP